MSAAHALPTTDPVAELLARARDAHDAIRVDDATALARALDAGDALIEAKARVGRGEWSERLAQTGIPPSTARLYMRLARNRARIMAAGCTSIRQARELLTERTAPPRPPHQRHRVSGHERGGDRYEEGYEAGYLAGSADGYRRGLADGQAAPQARRDGDAPLDRRDLKWLVKLAHPDVHGDDALRATRITQWLTALMEEASA